MTRPGVPGPSTLPAERTILAWTRTSFAFLVNGVLLTIKDWHGTKEPTEVIPAALAGAAALASFLITLRRQRILGRRPFPERLTARAPVYVVGGAVLVVIAVTAVTQLV
ncbi:DUF202 domain-containing protein [Mycobacterium sp. 663a-19]|uniref:DUF202 domain-containing protein n=1 Tax=Mycobacterium sp. 663a-19 TaxID=2986148 RepID=UPI002D1E4CBF|nr:DUF202 domain-containing protein [Mycobacterium sp. 663a-19]MEB3982493.1 DUF202 domain-containing protein [Mycobacterium sp. 663a-19]